VSHQHLQEVHLGHKTYARRLDVELSEHNVVPTGIFELFAVVKLRRHTLGSPLACIARHFFNEIEHADATQYIRCAPFACNRELAALKKAAQHGGSCSGHTHSNNDL